MIMHDAREKYEANPWKPDEKEPNAYYEGYLDRRDREVLGGYDWCMEMAADNFFDNDMGGLLSDDSYLGHLLNQELPESMKEEYIMDFSSISDRKSETRRTETYADLIRMQLLEYMELERNELVVSMIESMDEEKYQKNYGAFWKNEKKTEAGKEARAEKETAEK
jgi:hypothetical protein